MKAQKGTIMACIWGKKPFADTVVYYSDAAHFSILKAMRKMRMEGTVLATTDTGAMDLGD